MNKFLILILSLVAPLLTGCAGKKVEPYDYSEFQKSKPSSILLVMPTNSSPEVKASASVLAAATKPIAEKGYYVFPVALVDEIFKQNGLTDGFSIRNASVKKLREIFGADAVMYLDVTQYGSSYKILDSVTEVNVTGKLVDLRSGSTLWEGDGYARESANSNSNNGILIQLINAAITQVVNTTKDKAYTITPRATAHLFYAGKNGGLLDGPRLASPPVK